MRRHRGYLYSYKCHLIEEMKNTLNLSQTPTAILLKLWQVSDVRKQYLQGYIWKLKEH